MNGRTRATTSQLRLDPLGGEDARGDAGGAARREASELEPLKRLIVERTGGNPFFIEEMVQALFDEGALVRNGAVKVTRSLSQLRLPPTVQGILAARIDRLPREQKELLQTLAVIGRESPLGLIRQSGLARTTRNWNGCWRICGRASSSTSSRPHTDSRVRLQARADAGGRLQLVADRAPQTIA